MKIFYAFLISLLFIPITNLKATHTLGGGITWKQIGKDTFKISLEVFRDCNSTEGGSVPISVSGLCSTKSYATTYSKRTDITPVCDASCTACNKGYCSFKYGIEKFYVTTTIVVSDWRKKACCTLNLSWTRCCRSQTITTGPQSTYFVIDAQMNICDTINNNSPIWRNQVVTNICLGRDFNYDLGTNALNKNDSLRYTFAEPLTSSGRKVSWTGNYRYDKPIYYLGFPKTGQSEPRGFHLNANTGQITFRPMKVEFSIMKIKAEIYKNGNLNGYITREQPIIITKCPDNYPPVLSGANCATPFYQTEEINLCLNAENCVEICVLDKDKKDSVELSYQTNFPGAVISVSDSSKPILTFCAKPDSSQIGKDGYYISIIAKDDACPLIGTSSKYYKINVTYGLDYNINSKSDGCANAELSLYNHDTSQINCITWRSNEIVKTICDTSLLDTSTFKYKRQGDKEIVMNLEAKNGCRYIDSIKLNIPTKNTFMSASNDTSACAGDSINLNAHIKNVTGTSTWTWNNIYSNNGVSSTAKIGIGLNDTLIVVSYKDSFCSNSDTIQIKVNQLPLLSFNPVIESCFNDRDTFRFTQKIGTNIDSNNTYIWLDSLNNELKTTTDSKFFFPYSGKYVFIVKNSHQCEQTDTVKYTLNKPLESVYITDSILCRKQNDTIRTNKLKEGIITWFADPPYFIDNYPNTGVYLPLNISKNTALGIIYTNSKTNCKSRKTVTAYSVKPDLPQFSIEDNKCANDTFTIKTHLPYSTWKYETVQKVNPLKVVPFDLGHFKDSMYLLFSGKDSNNCGVTEDVYLQILETPVSKIFVKDTIFTNETFYPKPSIKQDTLTSFFWEFGDPVFLTSNLYQPSLSLDTFGEFRVKLTVTNRENNCSSNTIRNKDIIVVWPTSDDNFEEYSISIYPNPTNGWLSINSPNQQIIYCAVYSLLGEKVSIFSNTNTVDLEKLTKGSYILKIKTDKATFTKQIFKY